MHLLSDGVCTDLNGAFLLTWRFASRDVACGAFFVTRTAISKQ
jgi:hypothetical protein